VRPTNIRAIKVYENCGFIKTQIKKYPKNKYLPETIRMEKYL
jgi:ribosomal protein S18 acetylase RimI-like enzyme